MLRDVVTVVTSVSLFLLTGIYKRIQSLIWRVNGVRDARERATETSGYDQCVHVQHVIRRNKLTHFSPCNDFDFWTTHEGFVHPKTLLHPSISLYGLTDSEAIFVQTANGVNIYTSETHPFMKMAQANHAEKIFTMPMEAFHRFADDIGDPKVPVVLLSSTGRCGSTLLQNVFEKVPGTIALGEPDALNNPFIEKDGIITKTQRLALLRSALRVQCKTIPGAQRFLIKGTGATFDILEDVRSLFPTVKHVFLYRHTLPFVISSKALMQSTVPMRITRFLLDSDLIAKIFPRIRKNMCIMLAGDKRAVDISPSICSAGILCAMASVIYTKYRQLVDEGFPIFSVLYEDLVQHKEVIIRDIFKRLDIDEKHIKVALEAYKTDSQKGSSISRKSTGKRETLSAREILDVNRVLELFGLPECSSVIDLPKRILTKAK